MNKKELIKYTMLLSLGIGFLQIGLSLFQNNKYSLGIPIMLCGIFLIAFYTILREE